MRASAQHEASARVDTVIAALPTDVPRAIDRLLPWRDLALPLLRDRFRDPATGPTELLNAACALAAFGEVDHDFLIRAIPSAPAGAEECKNIVAALRRAGAPAGEALWQRTNEEKDPAARARLASTLLHLDDTRGARLVLAYGPDPVYRTAFIHRYEPWHGDLSVLSGRLRKAEDPGFSSGICTALGKLDPAPFLPEVRQELQKVLHELYLDAPDAGTHATAEWVLRQWKVALPKIELSGEPVGGRRWFVNRQRMTMVECNPRPGQKFLMGERDPYDTLPPTPHPVTLTRPFLHLRPRGLGGPVRAVPQ